MFSSELGFMPVFRGNSGDSQKACLQFRPKPTSSGLEVEAKFTFEINIPSVNAPASTNKVFIFKLTVEDYFKNHSE